MIVAASAAGCGARAYPVPAGATGVGRIELRGAHSVDADEVIDGLGLAHARDNGQPYARFLVTLDRRRIRTYYVRRGFLAVTVGDEVVASGNRADVVFTIEEGRRARLARVEITGAPNDVAPSALREAIAIADGATFDYDTYERSQPRMLEVMQEHGYARARVQGLVIADVERSQAVIRFDVEPGPPAVFGEVTISGVPAGLEQAVAARVELTAGARYSPRAIERTRVALYELGRFSLVRIDPDRDEGEVVKVEVTVVEAPRHEVRLGGGLGADPVSFEVRGRAAYGVAAWPWPLTTTRTELRPALVYLRDDGDIAPRVDAILSIDRLDLLWPRYGGTAEASFSYTAVEAYTSYGPRLRLTARTPTYGRIVQATIGWQLGLIAYRDLSPVLDDPTIDRLGIGPEVTERLGTYEGSVVVDLRDDRVAPRRGGYLEVRTELGTVAAGGAKSYVRVAPEVRGYASAGPVVLAGRARVGALIGDAPTTRRFFAGGANSQRGFPERQLAPFAEMTIAGVREQVPYGGTASAELSAELRFPLPAVPYLPPLATAAFLDGGDVAEAWGGLAVDDLHWATGLGLRVPTPIGAVRLDVGYRLNRHQLGEPRSGSRFAYHLSVGEAF